MRCWTCPSADTGDVQGLCDDDVTVQQFCSRYVEPMGEESDHIQLVALTDALLVRTHTWELQTPPRNPLLGFLQIPGAIRGHAPAFQYSTLHLCLQQMLDPDVDGP